MWDAIFEVLSTTLSLLVIIGMIGGLMYLLYQFREPLKDGVRWLFKRNPKPRKLLYRHSFWWLLLDLIILTYPVWMTALLTVVCIVWMGSPAVFIAAFFLWVIFPIGFVLASPRYAAASAKAFEERRERWLIIFTQRPPHRLRTRIKGARPVDFAGYIPPGRTFKGVTPDGSNLSPEEDAFWELVKIPNAEAPTGPEVHKLATIRLWVQYLNLWTDVSLIGVRFVFDVLEYPLEKYRLTEGRDEKQKLDFNIEPPRYTPGVGFELSNHIRTAPFRWVVYLPAAETTGGLRFRIITALYLRTVNPMRQIRNQESWSQFVNTAVVDTVSRALRSLTEERVRQITVKTGTGLEAADPMVLEIRKIEPRLRDTVGLEIDDTIDEDGEDADERQSHLEKDQYSGGVQIIEIEPEFRDDTERKAFTSVWVAEREALAKKKHFEAEAEGEALVTQKQLAAMAEHPELAVEARKADAIERAAEKGANITIMTGGGSSQNEALLTQMLSELQKMGRQASENNRRRRRRDEDGD